MEGDLQSELDCLGRLPTESASIIAAEPGERWEKLPASQSLEVIIEIVHQKSCVGRVGGNIRTEIVNCIRFQEDRGFWKVSDELGERCERVRNNGINQQGYA